MKSYLHYNTKNRMQRVIFRYMERAKMVELSCLFIIDMLLYLYLKSIRFSYF